MQTPEVDHFLRAEADLAADERRRLKSERLKYVGDPIELPSKIIQMVVRGNDCWTAESGRIVRRVDLESGKTKQLYRGHTAPVSTLALYDLEISPGNSETLLISGSWDKTIKIWNTKTKELLCETVAHNDFIKRLLVIPALKILVSSSSDKTAKLWDLAPITSAENPQRPLNQLASISAHTRPVEALAFTSSSQDDSILLVTGDSMGVIKVWSLGERAWNSSSATSATVRCSPVEDIKGHATGIGELSVEGPYLWSASTDSTVQLRKYPSKDLVPSVHTIAHPVAVKCLLSLSSTPLLQPYLITGSGDTIRIFDVSELVPDDEASFDKPPSDLQEKGKEHLIAEVDAHSHQITSLGLWIKQPAVSQSLKEELIIISSSLDGTVRKWKLLDLLAGKAGVEKRPEPLTTQENDPQSSLLGITEEEERELAELMGDD